MATPSFRSDLKKNRKMIFIQNKSYKFALLNRRSITLEATIIGLTNREHYSERCRESAEKEVHLENVGGVRSGKSVEYETCFV